MIVGIFFAGGGLCLCIELQREVSKRNSDLLIIRICLFMVHSDFFRHFCRMTIVFSFVAAMLGGVSLDYKERLDIAGRKNLCG